MKSVLVTGGAGNLGRRASWELLRRGHTVRVLTHRSTHVVEGVESFKGDVVSGAGVDEAIAGVDAVVHTATSRGGRSTKSEVAGVRTMVRAAERAGAHLVYVSKVGVETNRSPYYQAKWEAERVVESLGVDWSIQRVTQFHDLIEQILSAPALFKVPELAFQPVDVTEVASRLADIVEAGPSGRLPDFGGPELLGIETLARRRRRITGRRCLLVRVPRIGRIGDYARGGHLSPEHREGTITWAEWLKSSVAGR
jgi:uncharacterized protein YbjT (DUF2867 family)